jgi:hypothetical protein
VKEAPAVRPGLLDARRLHRERLGDLDAAVAAVQDWAIFGQGYCRVEVVGLD